MKSETPREIHRLRPKRDFELECEELGPSARMMLIQADPGGGIMYQFGKRLPRCLALPQDYALRTFGLIDEAVSSTLFDTTDNSLVAVGYLAQAGTVVFLFGEDYGVWIDAEGREQRSEEIPALLRKMRVPVVLQEFKQLIAIDFTINIYARELFHPDLRAFFHEDRGLRHRLNLIFHYPDGKFVTSRLSATETATGKERQLYEVETFPLIWPKRAAGVYAAVATEESQENAAAGKEKKTEAKQPPPRREAKPESAGAAKEPPQTEEPPKAKPARGASMSERLRRRMEQIEREKEDESANETTSLPTLELIRRVASEADPEKKWRLMEPNLALGRAERTYALILQDSDLVAEKAREWAPARIKAVFSDQPGAVMIGLMLHWRVNQVLAVVDGNPESARILEWLREREIDRLLNLKLAGEVTSVQVARQVLNVDTNADGASIKKTWRTLLGFLNADLGRVEERAIHRKKDEIAKELHVARDILMKKLG